MLQASSRPAAGAASRPGSTLGLTALTAAAPISWGTTYLVTTEFLPPGHPLVSTVIRALPAGLILLAITRKLPHGTWLLRSLLLGILNIGAFNALLFVAAYRLPGGVAATLNSFQPLFVAGLAFLLLREKPTRWRLGWSLVGVLGVALIVLRGQLSFDPLGILAGISAAGMMAAGVVLTRRWGRPDGVGATTMAGWQLTAGGLVLLPLALALEGLPSGLDLPAIGGYVWLAVVGAMLAYPIWFHGIGKLPVVALSFMALLSPVVATILGWLFLGEALTPWQGIGFALALTAIAAAQLSPDVVRKLIRIPATAKGE